MAINTQAFQAALQSLGDTGGVAAVQKLGANNNRSALNEFLDQKISALEKAISAVETFVDSFSKYDNYLDKSWMDKPRDQSQQSQEQKPDDRTPEERSAAATKAAETREANGNDQWRAPKGQPNAGQWIDMPQKAMANVGSVGVGNQIKDLLTAGKVAEAQAVAEKHLNVMNSALNSLYSMTFAGKVESITASGGDMSKPKSKWEGPLGFEGKFTGDNRYIKPMALDWAGVTFPQPFRWASEDIGAHDGARVIGTIEGINRLEDGTIWGWGKFDMGSELGKDAQRHVEEELTCGVSLDLDRISAEVSDAGAMASEGADLADAVEDMNITTIKKARTRSATLVALPAFEGARIKAVSDWSHEAQEPAEDPSEIDELAVRKMRGTLALGKLQVGRAKKRVLAKFGLEQLSEAELNTAIEALTQEQQDEIMAGFAEAYAKADAILEKAAESIGLSVESAAARGLALSVPKIGAFLGIRIDRGGMWGVTLPKEGWKWIDQPSKNLHKLADSFEASGNKDWAEKAKIASRDVDSRLNGDDIDVTGAQERVDKFVQEWYGDKSVSEGGVPDEIKQLEDFTQIDSYELWDALDQARQNEEEGGERESDTTKGVRDEEAPNVPLADAPELSDKTLNELDKLDGREGNDLTDVRDALMMGDIDSAIEAAYANGFDRLADLLETDREVMPRTPKPEEAVKETAGAPDLSRFSDVEQAVFKDLEADGYTWKEGDDGWELLNDETGEKVAGVTSDGKTSLSPLVRDLRAKKRETMPNGGEDVLPPMKETVDEEAYPAIPDDVVASLPEGSKVYQPGDEHPWATGEKVYMPYVELPQDWFQKQIGMTDEEIKDAEGEDWPGFNPELLGVAYVDGKWYPIGGGEEFLGGEGWDSIDQYAKGIIDSEEMFDEIAGHNSAEIMGRTGSTFPPAVWKELDMFEGKGVNVDAIRTALESGNIAAAIDEASAAGLFSLVDLLYKVKRGELAVQAEPEMDREERASLVASGAELAAPIKPPAAWFEDPKFKTGTPLTVTKEGRVFGHLALWGTCHAASASMGGNCVTVPNSETDYALFHLGVVETAEGTEVPVGRLAMETGHADDHFSSRRAIAHYENTGLAIADIRCGEDEFGIWFSGALRPDATPAQVRALKASPLSGDWRHHAGTNNLELVMALAVNMPGFAVPRPQFLVASGAVRTLVAAGMVPPKKVAKEKVEAALAGDQLAIDDIKFLQKLAARERLAEAKVLRQRALVASGMPDKIHALAAKFAVKPVEGSK